MQSESTNLLEKSEEEVLAHLRKCLQRTSPDTAIYLRIASVLSSQIAEGYFEAGAWLPSHRSLAKAFDVNLTTVTKSLNHLKEKGIISSRAGKGTVVRGRALDHTPPSFDVPEVAPEIDLSIHSQTSASVKAILQEGSTEIAASATCELDRYFPATGGQQGMDTARKWLQSRGFKIGEGNVAVTSGAQHALFVAMSAIMKRGDVILAPRLVYQGVKSAAKLLDLGLYPVEIDGDGIVPDDFERACQNPRVKSLFIMPNLDNPTSGTMSEERRKTIAAIARKHSLVVIEDDVYRALAPDGLPSIYDHYPEGTFYFSSLSKTISPGCRFGYLVYPKNFANTVAASVRGSIWMTDRFSMAMAQWLIESGAAEKIVQITKQTNITRHSSALRILGNHIGEIPRESNIIWLPIDTDDQAILLRDRLSARGVGVSASTVFKVGESDDSNGVRMYKSSAKDNDEWEIALRTIAKQIEHVSKDVQGRTPN